MSDTPQCQIRAVYQERTIRVYQAFGDEIADAALAKGTFVSPPFKMSRMTWIKPSFLWMMYRSGWGYKDRGQNRVLAIDISRAGFEWALEHSCPSHPGNSMSEGDWIKLKAHSPVRIQWDPERDLHLEPLPYRSIQIGLSGAAVELYVKEWIENISEVTALAHAIQSSISCNELDQARAMLPQETVYNPLTNAGL